MASKVNVPDFDFSGFYYGEILEALLDYLTVNVPEISNRSPYEPAIQILRAYALVGHLNNTLLDMVANEGTLPTSRLRESVVRHLALIGYVPKANIPAVGDLLLRLSASYSSSTLVVPDNGRFGTKRKAETPAIVFEADAAITVPRTDILTGALDYDEGATAWTDRTTAMNTDALPSSFFTASLHPNDAIYLCHSSTLTDYIEFSGITSSPDFGDDRPSGLPTPSPVIVLLEYYDGELEDAQPDSVTIDGSNLKFVVDTLVGTSDPRDGLQVKVVLNSSNAGAFYRVIHDGTNNVITTSGYLGQASPPSTTASDYTVGTYWHEIPNVNDTTMASLPVTAEAVASGTGSLTSFSGTLDRWPLEPGTIVTFSYPVSAATKTATFDLSDGSIGGNGDAGTTVDAATGAFTLETQDPPDSGSNNVTVDYSRKAQTLQQDGRLDFKVPFTTTEDWRKTPLDDALGSTHGSPPSTDGFWVRYRIVSLGNNADLSSLLTLDRIKWDQGRLYIRCPVTQGQTYSNEIIGSGDSTASQSFTLSRSPVLEGTVRISVSGDAYEQVDDFISSTATDQHYIVRIDSDGVATVTFGDGTNGRVAPAGSNNIIAEYRVGGAEDGNVGSGQITVNRSGLSRVRSVSNPRSMTGWSPQEGSTGDASLERLKRDGVADLRTLGRAVTTGDYEYLTAQYYDKTTKGYPYSRANAIEAVLGPKTIKLVVVPVGGTVPSSPTTRNDLETYFNGDTSTGGTIEGVGLVNTEVTVVDYSPVSIDVTAEITGGDKDIVAANLESLLSAEALDDTGLEYRWSFGQTISVGKLITLIFGSDSEITDVNLTTPSAAITLLDDELPVAGTITITEA